MNQMVFRRAFPIFIIVTIMILLCGCTATTPAMPGDPEVLLPMYLCGNYSKNDEDDILSRLLNIPGLLEVPGPDDNWNHSYGYSQKFYPRGNKVNISYVFVVINNTFLQDTEPPSGSKYFAVYVLSAVYGEYRSTVLLRDNLTLMMNCNDTLKPIEAGTLAGSDYIYDPESGFHFEFEHMEQGWVVFEVPEDFTPDGSKLLVFYDYDFGVTGAWNL